jgi:formylglycine-generating enzyme required for sulfatase activity
MEAIRQDAILDALYEHYVVHPGDPKITLGELYKAVGAVPSTKERVGEVLCQLRLLQGKGWVDVQSLRDGFGGTVEITAEGVEVARDRRQLIDNLRESTPQPSHLVPTDTSIPGLSPDVLDAIHIPAGPFWMGSSRDDSGAHDNEKPRRQVNLPAYEIGRYPVTNAQYACFLADQPHHPVPYSKDDRAHPYNWDSQTRIYPEGKADHPVVLVSWEDAMIYCDWLSQIIGKHCRLPTEEEWEKATRGGLPETRRYPWGDDWESGFCNTKELGENDTTSVYKFENKNRSPRGVIDMVGNVWEWTSSWYKQYPNSLHDSPNYGQLYRVVRGGSWRSRREDARISCRGRYTPESQRPYLGFRVVLEAGIQLADTASREKASQHVDQIPLGVHARPSRKDMSNATMDRTKLRQNLTRYFSKDELLTLCFDLGIDYENFPETKRGIARELVAHLDRCGSLSKLREICKQWRPKAPW